MFGSHPVDLVIAQKWRSGEPPVSEQIVGIPDRGTGIGCSRGFLRVARDSPEARDDGPTVNETELLCRVQKPVREGVAQHRYSWPPLHS